MLHIENCKLPLVWLGRIEKVIFDEWCITQKILICDGNRRFKSCYVSEG